MSNQFYANLRRVLIWGVVLFVVAAAQTGLFSRLAEALPYGAAPDLLLAAVVAIAIFDSERAGAVAGIAAGFLAGALGGVGVNLAPLLYLLCGYVCGAASTMSLSANLPSWVVYMLGSGVARAVVTLVGVAAGYADYGLVAVAREVLLPEFAATFAMSFLVYFPVRRIAGMFNRRIKIPE